MKKTYIKSLYRDIKDSLTRFLSIIIIIAVGTAFYSGVRAASPDMKKSGDYYFNKNKLMDFKLLCSTGFTNEDLNEVKKQKDISLAEGVYETDGITRIKKHEIVININSMPKDINNIKIVKGRKAAYKNEAVVEDDFFNKNKLKLGDKLTIKSGNSTSIKEKIKYDEFIIVGTADSPLYISEQRQLSSVGTGTVKGFMYISKEAFRFQAFTALYVRLNKVKSEDSLINYNEYINFAKSVKSKLESLGAYRSKIKFGREEPKWIVIGRSENIGYETYRLDSDRIDNIGKVFPLIFFLVAALVSLTTITRMVDEKRIEIGIYKALGYSSVMIAAHFLIYSFISCFIGSILGVLIGYRVFPPLIITAYNSLYVVPYRVIKFNYKYSALASFTAVLFTSLAALLAAKEEIKEVPASLMRPKAPKSGRTIFLERFEFIWKNLKFSSKVAARNIFRYKQRFFMTVIGISACTGLMITGFSLKGAVLGAAENQFNKIYKYNMQGILSESINTEERKNMLNNMTKDKNIKSIIFTYNKNSKVRSLNNDEDAYVIVTDDNKKFTDFINLINHNEKINLNDEGVILTEKLSKLINKKAGEYVYITLNNKKIRAKIIGVCEHYISHYIYMSKNYYENLTGEKLKLNAFYGLLNSTDGKSEDNTLNHLKSINLVENVTFKNNTHIDFNKTIKSINLVILVLIISAGILAFVIIYNLTSINIAERKSELATIKVLGFYNKELALYIYRENVVLTILGSILGIFIGILMNKFVIGTAETNILMFYRHINPIYFIYSIVLTMIFSAIINAGMYKRFDKIDMIESLKNVE